MKESFATAPPSVGNMAVGFDILGHALSLQGDQVRASMIDQPGVMMGPVSGLVKSLPEDPKKNTAGAAALSLLEHHPLPFGVRLDLHKMVALGSGMGGSASSAVAAVMAVNQLLNEPLEKSELLPFALAGEVVASGAVHGDNVAPSLFGGIVFMPPDRPEQFAQIPAPDDLRAVLVRPQLRLDTDAGRGILQPTLALGDVVKQTSNLAAVICACYQNDLNRLEGVLNDVLIEPQRCQQIAGFRQTQQAARSAGALGCTLSGSGPSIVAWCRGADRETVAAAMSSAIGQHHKEFQMAESEVNASGAKIIDSGAWLGE